MRLFSLVRRRGAATIRSRPVVCAIGLAALLLCCRDTAAETSARRPFNADPALSGALAQDLPTVSADAGVIIAIDDVDRDDDFDIIVTPVPPREVFAACCGCVETPPSPAVCGVLPASAAPRAPPSSF